MVVPSLWPVIGSGWACEPILANEMEEVFREALEERFLASKETIWEETPPSSCTKNYHVWLCCLDLQQLLWGHEESPCGAKPSAEGGKTVRLGTPGHKTLLELWVVSCPELSPTLGTGNIQSSHCFGPR